MTTVACNSTSIACDLQFTYGGSTKFKGRTKVLTVEGRIADDMFGVKKAYIGFSGNADRWGQVVSWFSDPSGKPPKCRDIEFLMLNDKKQIFHGTNLRNWMLLPDPHFAVGTGMQFAIAAMSAGKTPLEACKIASKHDIYTGQGFLEYSFP